MILQQLWTRGTLVRVPGGATGMVCAFDRRTNLVTVVAGSAASGGLLEDFRTGKVGAQISHQMRSAGIVVDHHFTQLRLVEAA